MRLLLQKTATVHMVIIAFVPPFVNIHFDKWLVFYNPLAKLAKNPSDFDKIRRIFNFLFCFC